MSQPPPIGPYAYGGEHVPQCPIAGDANASSISSSKIKYTYSINYEVYLVNITTNE